MKFLAICGTKRFPGLPNVPTFAEAGLKDFEASGWFAMFLPANAPKEVVAKLSTEVARIMKLAEVQAKLNDRGLQSVDPSPHSFAAVRKSAKESVKEQSEGQDLGRAQRSRPAPLSWSYGQLNLKLRRLFAATSPRSRRA